MNMTFQIWGVGIISLGIAVGVAWVFRVGLMIWMVVVDRDRDRGGSRDGDRGGGRDNGNSDDENDKTVKMMETVKEVVDNRNRQ
jgi:hypothetical protein